MTLPGRALVLGLARSGRAAALALARREVEVVAVDRKVDLAVGDLAVPGIDVRLGVEDVSLLDGVGLLVKSPGVPGEVALVGEARRRGIPVWSEVELGARLLPNPILGVTGTNGKTTTAELLGALFRAAGRAAAVAGNIGTPLTALDGELGAEAWVVCELSSFQLEDAHTLRPRVGVLLNLEPDHLDRHGTIDRYRDAKLRLFGRQGPDDTAVVPRGFGAIPGQALRVEFSAEDELPAEPLIPGPHNRANAAAATAAARAAGLHDEAIARGLRSFVGVPHRLELVAEVGGVRYVNDSKATNTAAARQALRSFGQPLHVILGGSLKGERFDGLAKELVAAARAAYLIGAAAGELASALDSAGMPYRRAGTLERAVAAAAAAAQPGEVVLLSPACASYDQFENFEQRGEEFRRLVQNLGA